MSMFGIDFGSYGTLYQFARSHLCKTVGYQSGIVDLTPPGAAEAHSSVAIHHGSENRLFQICSQQYRSKTSGSVLLIVRTNLPFGPLLLSSFDLVLIFLSFVKD
eukprot:1275811-Amphidinium_carterae.1